MAVALLLLLQLRLLATRPLRPVRLAPPPGARVTQSVSHDVFINVQREERGGRGGRERERARARAQKGEGGGGRERDRERAYSKTHYTVFNYAPHRQHTFALNPSPYRLSLSPSLPLPPSLPLARPLSDLGGLLRFMSTGLVCSLCQIVFFFFQKSAL